MPVSSRRVYKFYNFMYELEKDFCIFLGFRVLCLPVSSTVSLFAPPSPLFLMTASLPQIFTSVSVLYKVRNGGLGYCSL